MSKSKNKSKNKKSKEKMDSNLRCMSYNVNFGLAWNGHISEDAVMNCIKAIEDEDCDIIFLQETTPEWETVLQDYFKKTHPYSKFYHSENWCAGGEGVLSKMHFEEVGWIPPVSDWFHGWILNCETPIGTIQFLNVHLQPPMDANGSPLNLMAFQRSKTTRLNDLKHWVGFMDESMPRIILGDFNEHHSGFFSGPSCKWLVEEMGMRDSVYDLDPNTYSWEWPLVLGFKLKANFDHIFYSPSKLMCNYSKVVRQGSSDHFPVVGHFKMLENVDESEE